MREIKFRIWDKKKKRWFHGGTDPKSIANKTDAISLFGETITMGDIIRDQNDDKSIRLDRANDLIPLQFTGLKDKNGREIYEGDIVRIDLRGDDGLGVILESGVILWNSEKAGFMWSDGDPSDKNNYWLAESDTQTREIIGNIHENPELLEDECPNQK